MSKLKQAAAGFAVVVAFATTFIAPWEGLRRNAYLDVVGIPTVCYGETRNVKMGDKYTTAECEAMLRARVAEIAAAVDRCIPDDVPAKSRAMFYSLAYNIGPGDKRTGKGFCYSKTIQSAFARHDYKAACDGLLLYNRAGGKVVAGLNNRRVAEHAVCLKGLVEGR